MDPPHLSATGNPEAWPVQIYLQVQAKVCRTVFSKPSSLLTSPVLDARADSNLVSKTSFYGPRQVQEARFLSCRLGVKDESQKMCLNEERG